MQVRYVLQSSSHNLVTTLRLLQDLWSILNFLTTLRTFLLIFRKNSQIVLSSLVVLVTKSGPLVL